MQFLTHNALGFTLPELVRFSSDRADCMTWLRPDGHERGAGMAISIVRRKSGHPANDIDTCW